MPIELKVTPYELQLIHHALSSLGAKYAKDYQSLLDAGKGAEAQIKHEIYEEVWALYLRLPNE